MKEIFWGVFFRGRSIPGDDFESAEQWFALAHVTRRVITCHISAKDEIVYDHSPFPPIVWSCRDLEEYIPFS